MRRRSGVPRGVRVGLRRRDGGARAASRRSAISRRASTNSAGVYDAKSRWRSTSAGLHRTVSDRRVGGAAVVVGLVGVGSSGRRTRRTISSAAARRSAPRRGAPGPERRERAVVGRRCPRAASPASPGPPSTRRSRSSSPTHAERLARTSSVAPTGTSMPGAAQHARERDREPFGRQAVRRRDRSGTARHRGCARARRGRARARAPGPRGTSGSCRAWRRPSARRGACAPSVASACAQSIVSATPGGL